MKSPYEMFGTDKTLEKEKGITIDYGAFKITVLRAGGSNTKYSGVLSAKLRPHQRAVQNGTISEELNRRLLAEVYAEAVIIGWTDLKDADGNAIEFSRENCVKLLLDLPDLFNDIIRSADDIRNFRAQQVEEEAKN